MQWSGLSAHIYLCFIVISFFKKKLFYSTAVLITNHHSVTVLCSNRVSQMTKTYNDIEAVTRLLEEVSLTRKQELVATKRCAYRVVKIL